MRSLVAELVALGALLTALSACSTTTTGHSVGQAAGGESVVSGQSNAALPSDALGSSGETGSSQRSPGAASPDGMAHPCSLLIEPEAEALAGTKLMAGTEAGQGDDKTLCQYVGPTTGPLAQVQVLVGDGAKKVLDIDRDVLKHPFTTAAGIGDEAYQEDDNLFLRKADVWVSINLSLLNDPGDNVKAMQTAGGEIAHRLG